MTKLNTYQAGADEDGHFGIYGGAGVRLEKLFGGYRSPLRRDEVIEEEPPIGGSGGMIRADPDDRNPHFPATSDQQIDILAGVS